MRSRHGAPLELTSGEDITWWASKLETVVEDARAFLDEVASLLSRLDLAPASISGRDSYVAARRLLLAKSEEFVGQAVVLETHLVPSCGLGFPLFVAAWMRFRRSVPRKTVSDELSMDPPLERLLLPGGALREVHLSLETKATPKPLIAELRLRPWPLLQLEDDRMISEEVVPVIGAWLARTRG